MKSYNIVNGNIVTLNSSIPIAESLSIKNGKIQFINKLDKDLENINLHGATVIPGFIDAHFHLKNFGKRLEQVDLKNINSLDKIKLILEKKIQGTKTGDWILGFGWDQNLWPESKYPDCDFLNDISPDNPIYLTRIDGHSAWINNMAIKYATTSKDELKKIDGGALINDCIVLDNSMSPFVNVLPKDTVSQIKKWILRATTETVKMGITGVHDAWQDRNTVTAIKELISENKFPIRCYGMLAGNDRKLLNEHFQSGHYLSPYLSIRSVKAFIDGALGSRGAALHEPYCDDHNNCGLILISQDEFDDLVNQCYKYNFQLNTHAIGDRGNHYVLNAYKKVLKQGNNYRWRIEHAQMVNDNDMQLFKNHSILPSMQPSHCTSDMKWLHERLGFDRLKLISRWNSFIKMGLPIPGGSDCPIEDGNPLFEFYAAVTRQDHTGWPKEGWQSQEKINSNQALNMFTKWAAYGGFQENSRGKIKIGYDADLTVLSNNLLDIDVKDILDIKILKTIVNGDFVYENSSY